MYSLDLSEHIDHRWVLHDRSVVWPSPKSICTDFSLRSSKNTLRQGSQEESWPLRRFVVDMSICMHLLLEIDFNSLFSIFFYPEIINCWDEEGNPQLNRRDQALGVGNGAFELRNPWDAELVIKLETINRGLLRTFPLCFIYYEREAPLSLYWYQVSNDSYEYEECSKLLLTRHFITFYYTRVLPIPIWV